MTYDNEMWKRASIHVQKILGHEWLLPAMTPPQPHRLAAPQQGLWLGRRMWSCLEQRNS